MSFTVIIPSRTKGNLEACVASIRQNEVHGATVMAVWDGRFPLGLGPGSDVDAVLCGEKPFIFARNVNLAIRASGHWRIPSGGPDILILNDDTRLLTPHGFSKLARAAEDHPEFGVVSAAIDGAVGNQEQHRAICRRCFGFGSVRNPPVACDICDGTGAPTGIREVEGKNVAFIAVYIRREVINKIGMLDERFIHYGWEDNDFTLRCRQAGLKLGVYDQCVVEHGKLPSTFRDGNKAGDIEPGRKLFIEKWGSDSL